MHLYKPNTLRFQKSTTNSSKTPEGCRPKRMAALCAETPPPEHRTHTHTHLQKITQHRPTHTRTHTHSSCSPMCPDTPQPQQQQRSATACTTGTSRSRASTQSSHTGAAHTAAHGPACLSIRRQQQQQHTQLQELQACPALCPVAECHKRDKAGPNTPGDQHPLLLLGSAAGSQ